LRGFEYIPPKIYISGFPMAPVTFGLVVIGLPTMPNSWQPTSGWMRVNSGVERNKIFELIFPLMKEEVFSLPPKYYLFYIISNNLQQIFQSFSLRLEQART
jgi:hypothetical protein